MTWGTATEHVATLIAENRVTDDHDHGDGDFSGDNDDHISNLVAGNGSKLFKTSVWGVKCAFYASLPF